LGIGDMDWDCGLRIADGIVDCGLRIVDLTLRQSTIHNPQS
jgi:hypothetical protein